MSGPQRQAWTFPKRPSVLIAALSKKRADLVKLIDEKLDEEQAAERGLAEYRERLRVAGVEKYATAQPDGRRDTFSSIRSVYQGYARELREVDLYLAAIRDDQDRDPDRLYKLSREDLEWFGITVSA